MKLGTHVAAGLIIAGGIAALAAGGVLLLGAAAATAIKIGMTVFLAGSLYVGEQALSDIRSGRVSDLDQYTRKAVAGSVVGFLTGASGLLMAEASLLGVLALGFGEGLVGSIVTQKLLNEDGKSNRWGVAIAEAGFSAVTAGFAWKEGRSVRGGSEALEGGSKGGTYSGDLMSPEEAARYSEHWRELGIGSDNTWKAFKDANPNATIDDYFEIVQKQSPWPLGINGTPTTLKAGDRFFMAVENDAPENVIGGFGVKERIDSTDFVRSNLAVKYDWKTSCNVIREFEVNSGIELNVNAGPVGPQIDLAATYFYQVIQR